LCKLLLTPPSTLYILVLEMEEITDRQKELLKIIIDEYIDTANPVGSEALVSKYKLKYSPATIRNEMASLIRKGFLGMTHSSSGRKPTSLGLRFYINELMEEREVPVLQEVSMKQRVWQDRYEYERTLRNIVLALSEATKYLALVSLDDGYLVHAGSVNILEYPEFFDIEVSKSALQLLDNADLLERLYAKGFGGADVKILIGEELDYDNLDCCGLVYTPFNSKKRGGFLGVFGPDRMPYSKVIPTIRYMKGLINELLGGF